MYVRIAVVVTPNHAVDKLQTNRELCWIQSRTGKLKLGDEEVG